jgi:hypothetical protein
VRVTVAPKTRSRGRSRNVDFSEESTIFKYSCPVTHPELSGNR